MAALVGVQPPVVVACPQASEVSAVVSPGAMLLLWELAICKTEHTRGGRPSRSSLCSSRQLPMLAILALGLSCTDWRWELGDRLTVRWNSGYVLGYLLTATATRATVGVREAVARSARNWRLQMPLNGGLRALLPVTCQMAHALWRWMTVDLRPGSAKWVLLR